MKKGAENEEMLQVSMQVPGSTSIFGIFAGQSSTCVFTDNNNL